MLIKNKLCGTVVRPWGSYEIVNQDKIITINPWAGISLQYHKLRVESWIIIKGTGSITLGKKVFFTVKSGDRFLIKCGEIHRAAAFKNGLVIFEHSTGKIDEDDIVRLDDAYCRMNTMIVSGYFDPLHNGHIEYFKLAKELGSKLILILNNDFQARLKKGAVFMPMIQRKKILESIKYVDEVFCSIDSDLSVCNSIGTIVKWNPNAKYIFAKGGDRKIKEIPETKVCNRLGITLVDGLGKKIQSSSMLVGRIARNKKIWVTT